MGHPPQTPRPWQGRALRLGSRGDQVLRLQARLRDLGYDPGPLDGTYGYLTFAAVRDFQRDYRLRVDGVAGRRVRAVLYDEGLRTTGEWLVVAELNAQSGRTVARRTLGRQTAALSAVSVPIGIDVDAGQAGMSPGFIAEEAIEAAGVTATELRDVVGQRLPTWITLHTRRDGVAGQYSRGVLQAMLHTRRGVSQLTKLVDAAASLVEAPVLHLDLGHLGWGDGARFLGIVKRSARRAAALGKELVVSLPLRDLKDPWTRVTNDIDYAAIGAIASRVVLVPPARLKGTDPPRPPSSLELAERVRAVVRRVPPWRCLLAIPTGALVFPTDPAQFSLPISYQRAMALAYGARTRPQWDDAATRPMFRCRCDDRDVVIWLETKASFLHKIDIVRRTRLAGVYLSSIGDEDVRLWRVLRDGLPKNESPAS